MADEEEVVEGEEAQPAATEFVPEASAKPKSNVYTALLVLTFCAFFAGCWLAGNEAYNHYDVTFWGIFKKEARRGGGPAEAPAPSTGGGATNTSTDTKDAGGDKKDK